uniref:Uncharacterized protein n=1 Tax=Phlegmariurus squarrosus TaxID=73615 RepID=H9M850_PHLSQ|nr:hypothetical protein HusqMp56 [Phlegmariurus squarrosus]AEV55757.1 hypothetical protein HusqMp56 [Phlegmariurus squarrosus]
MTFCHSTISNSKISSSVWLAFIAIFGFPFGAVAASSRATRLIKAAPCLPQPSKNQSILLNERTPLLSSTCGVERPPFFTGALKTAQSPYGGSSGFYSYLARVKRKGGYELLGE